MNSVRDAVLVPAALLTLLATPATATADQGAGEEPMTFPAGTCFYTPPGVAMTAANLGSDDVRLIDTFVSPPDAPAIIVLEPGWPDLTDPTG